MDLQPGPNLYTHQNWQRVGLILAVIAAVLGLTGLCGWVFNIPLLTTFLSDGSSMKVNTAIMIISTAGSTIAINYNRKKLAWGLVLFAMLICTLTLLEYLLNTDLHIDDLLFNDIYTNAAVTPPGRMSAYTGISGLLTGLAIICAYLKKYYSSQLILTLAFFVIYASLLGHLFGVQIFYIQGRFSGIAFHSALGLLLLNLAALCYQYQYGWAVTLFTQMRGKNIINYILSYLLCAGPLLVAFYLYLINHTGFTPASGILTLVIFAIAISVPLAYFIVNRINRIDSDLLKANQRLEIALNAANLGSYDLDLATGNIICNDQFKKNFGISPQAKFNFSNLIETVIPDQRITMQDKIYEAINKHQAFRTEYQVLWPDNTIHWIKASGMPQYDTWDKAISVIGVTIDITDEKEGELLKNDFIGMVSHELKTPLTTLKAYVQVLNKKAEGSDDEFQTGALQKVEQQINKMSTMINGFLNVARLESGQIYLDISSFNVTEVLEETVAEYRLLHPAAEITIKATTDTPVKGDRNKISQVISNLVSNAIKYSPREKVVELSAEIDDKCLQVTIRDKGLGIDAVDQNRVFERFYRAKNPHTLHISGFGIGLYLSAEIINRHKGKIWVESNKDEGSTFYFKLPVE
jgi:signal transduction histidine kinase